MKKIIVFIIQLIIIVALAVFLTKHQWPMMIRLGEYELTTNSSFFILFLIVFMGVYILIHKAVEGIYYAPKRIKQKIDYKNQLKGLESIANGLFYLSIDNNKKALKEAKIAKKKIPDHVMSNLLAAKSYTLEGKPEQAKKEYRKMVKNSKYLSLGFNGLIEIACLQENDDDIYSLSKQAVLLDSKNAYALMNLIDSQIDRNEISEAKDNIKKANKLKAVDKMEGQLRLAEIAYADAVHLQDKKEIACALKEISPYYDLDVDYLDLYVQLLVKSSQARKAKSAVKKEWKKNPYYQMASIWMELGPKDSLKKIAHGKELLKSWPSSHVAFELIAKACVDAEVWGEAKYFLTKAIETEEKISHFILMAKIEKHGFKNPEQHEFWMKKVEKGLIL